MRIDYELMKYDRKRKLSNHNSKFIIKNSKFAKSECSSLAKVKIKRAYGGCLGARRRRRTRQAAKRHGELQASMDPWISEWGNPVPANRYHPYLNT